MSDRPRRTLLRGGSIYSPADPFATAMVVDGDTVVWIGSDIGGDVHRDTVDTVVELDGALVTPAFVDAHIHATNTGLTLQTTDLSQAATRDQLLRLLREAARTSEGVLLAHGWDESRWADQALPTIHEIDDAVAGRPAYISRTDVHSAMVSTSLLDQLDAPRSVDGFSDNDGVVVLRRDAHHLARHIAQQSISARQRDIVQRLTLRTAASLGIAAVHEMAGPEITSDSDLDGLLAIAAGGETPLVTGYWGVTRLGDDELAHATAAPAGDLFADGSIGSHTAHVRDAYIDLETYGTAYLTTAQIRDHFAWASMRGIQAGFHVIGDAAMDAVVAGLREAAELVSPDVVRAARHRLEHAEMLTVDHLTTLLEFGVVLSVQPVFDERWGGDAGMYAQRLGVERALTLNPFATASRMGVVLAFGSDAPVTPMNPWAAVRAAATMHNGAHSLSVRAAFQAHTRGGWRAVGNDSVGVLAPGQAAHYAVWRADELVVQSADARVSAWSTDPRSGTPGLPNLAPDLPLPTALRTVVNGRTVFDTHVLDEVAP